MKIKSLTLILLAPLGCAACSENRKPEPDPVKLEALIASMETESAREPGKAERLIASVEKVSPERIDPNLVVAVAN